MELRLRNLSVLKSSQKEDIIEEIILLAVGSCMAPVVHHSWHWWPLFCNFAVCGTKDRMYFPTSSHRAQPWDLLWPIKYARKWEWPVPSIGLKRPLSCLHLSCTFAITMKRLCPGQLISPSKIRACSIHTWIQL